MPHLPELLCDEWHEGVQQSEDGVKRVHENRLSRGLAPRRLLAAAAAAAASRTRRRRGGCCTEAGVQPRLADLHVPAGQGSVVQGRAGQGRAVRRGWRGGGWMSCCGAQQGSESHGSSVETSVRAGWISLCNGLNPRPSSKLVECVGPTSQQSRSTGSHRSDGPLH